MVSVSVLVVQNGQSNKKSHFKSLDVRRFIVSHVVSYRIDTHIKTFKLFHNKKVVSYRRYVHQDF